MILSSSKWTSLWSPFSSLCCREGGKGRGLTCAVPSSWRRLWTRTLPHALHTRSQPHPAEVDREALNTLCFAQSWVWSPSFSPPVISSGLIAPWDSRPGHQASHHCPPWPALMWRPLPSAGVNSNQVLFISMGTVLNSQQMFIFAVVCLIAKHQFLLFYCLDLCTKNQLRLVLCHMTLEWFLPCEICASLNLSTIVRHVAHQDSARHLNAFNLPFCIHLQQQSSYVPDAIALLPFVTPLCVVNDDKLCTTERNIVGNNNIKVTFEEMQRHIVL